MNIYICKYIHTYTYISISNFSIPSHPAVKSTCSHIPRLLLSVGVSTAIYGGFHSPRGSRIAGWLLDFLVENPNLKWMLIRGSPIYGNPHTIIQKAIELGDVEEKHPEVIQGCDGLR